jgi:transcriptional regulator with XRE-family HTH domain
MAYQIQAFAQRLRQARLHKGWSQRVLSGKAGIPQAHISRIESGAVDVKVSTLVELARLLDLELVLAPRVSIPAVEALIREAEASDRRLGDHAPAQTPAYSLDEEGSDEDPTND